MARASVRLAAVVRVPALTSARLTLIPLLLFGCSGRAADVIYLPSSADVVARMLEVAGVGPEDVIFDLGCGDGRIVIAAARDRGARGVCVDLDPSLVARSRRNADSAGVADRIEFRHGDMFETDLSSATVVALYLSPALNVRLRPKLFREVRPGAWIVSHNLGMGDWTPDTVVRVTWSSGATSAVQAWWLPADVGGTWELMVPEGDGERRLRVRLTQQYQRVTGTASERGRTVAVTDLRLAGDTLELTLADELEGRQQPLRLVGRVAGAEITGLGSTWRAIRR
jgi:SAM-dependent methyltransferase